MNIVRVVWLVGVLLLAAPSVGHAAADVPAMPAGARAGEFSIVDLPDAGSPDATPAPLTRLTPGQVESNVERVAGIRLARVRRPAAHLEVRYDPLTHLWTANLQEHGIETFFGTVIVDDVTGSIVASHVLPLGEYPSRLVERTAIDVAVADDRVRSRAREWGGVRKLRASGSLDDGRWEVDLVDPTHKRGTGKIVMRVDVDDATSDVTGVWTGIQIPWTMARGDRRAFGGDLNEPWIWLPFFVLFALVAVDWTRLRSWLTLDVAAVLAFGVSHEFFQRGMIAWSVPLAMPP
ncbi:MAG: hypothetical protein JWN41_1306, partial [Thermoleophilia bacterium]|nr:hypothetical protein [Thermoleophilia bacterium]